MNDWTIQSRANRCEVSGQPFADGEAFYTLLYRDEKQDALVRRDVSEASWRALQAEGKTTPPFCFWRAKFAAPAPSAPEALPRADADGLLRRFLAENRPEHRRVIYILALMLERKRLLRPTGSQADGGGSLLVYEHARTGETFLVADPGLRLDQIADVQREVAALLKG